MKVGRMFFSTEREGNTDTSRAIHTHEGQGGTGAEGNLSWE